jgi:hypothetical protein
VQFKKFKLGAVQEVQAQGSSRTRSRFRQFKDRNQFRCKVALCPASSIAELFCLPLHFPSSFVLPSSFLVLRASNLERAVSSSEEFKFGAVQEVQEGSKRLLHHSSFDINTEMHD